MSLVQKESPVEGIALLRINRPEALNALSVPVRLEIAALVDELEADNSIRVIVITGGDKVFAAGADLAELQKRTIRDAITAESRAAWTSITRCTKPIIAAVNGFALGGGCELALHCDIVIAGEGAKFGLPEVKVGIIPGAGGTQRLVRAVGKYKAARYLMTGDFISAEDASAMGIVSEVVPDEETINHALKIAGKIAARAPMAVKALKELIVLGPEASLDTALALETKAFQILFTSDDRDEGVAAFLEKRKPVFKGS